LTAWLEAREVSFRYPDGTAALDGVTVRAGPGEIVAVLGPNGSGKTTLLMILAGLLEPTSGEVLFGGRPLSTLQDGYRRICGVLFQNPRDQLLAPTVWEDVALGPSQLGLGGEELRSRVESALSALGISHLARRSPHRLSSGQAARVALAGLLAHDPQIILLDEPTASLDLEGRRALEGILLDARRRKKIVFVATQSSDLAAEFADRVYLVVGGRVRSSGRPEEVLSDGDALESVGVDPPTAVRVFRALFPDSPGRAPVRLGELTQELLRRLNGRPHRGWTPPADAGQRSRPANLGRPGSLR